MSKLSLQTRFILVAILALALSFASGAWHVNEALETATGIALEERLNLTRSVARHLDQDLERTLGHLAQVATFPDINLEDGDLEPEKAELRALYRPQAFSYVFLLAKDSLALWTEPYLPNMVGVKRLEYPHIQEALRTGQPGIARMPHTLTPERPVIAPVVPIRNRQGTIVGALGAAIDPSVPPFADIFQDMARGKTGYLQFVDEDGLVLANTQGRGLFRKSDHADLFVSWLKEKKATINTYTVTEEDKGTFREVIAFAPLTVAPWGVALEQEEAELLAPTLGLRRSMLFSTVPLLAGVLLLVWVVARSVVDPVRKLVAASGRIAAGDLATPVPPLGQDEIGELGRSFEEMRGRLARWGEELETTVQKRTRELSVLYTIARAISTTLNLDELLEIVYREVAAVMPVEAFFIALYDRAANELDHRIRVDKGIREPAMRRPLATGLTSSIITSKQPLLIRDFEKEKDRLPPIKLWGTMEAPQSWLGVPMLLGENVVGVISVQAYRPNVYGEAEQELLTTIADTVAVAIENARLYEETRRHAAELEEKARNLEAVDRVSSLAGSSLDLDHILNTVAEEVVRLFGVDHSGILLFDQAHTSGRVAAEYPPTGAKGVQFPVQGYPAAELIIAQPQPLAFEEAQSDPLLAPVQETMRRLDIRSMLILPLVAKGEVVGSIGLDAVGKQRRFGSEEIALAQTIANQVAVAIENARLFQAERKKHDLAETMRAVAQVVTSSLDPTEVFELILAQVGRVVPYDSASIFTVQGKKVVFTAGRGFPQPELVKNLSFDIEATPKTRQVIVERKPLVLADVAASPDWTRVPGFEYIRSWIGAPMVVKDSVLGMLCLDKAEPNFYTPEDARLAFAFAGQAAVAVQNAQLFAQRERRVRELLALNRISQAVSAILDRDELMEELYRQTSLLLGTETFYIAFYHPETEDLEFAFGVEEGKRREPARRKMQAGLTEYIVRHRQPLLIPNDVEGFCQEHGVVPVGRPAKSWLGVPLLAGGQFLGVMAVQDFRNPQAFDQEDLELLSTIAGQAAVAFQNARLFQESQQRAREMSLLFQGSQALTTTIDLDELLPRAVAALKETLGYALCLVLLLDRDRNELYIKASAGDWPTMDPGMRFRVGIDGLIGHGAAQDRVLYVPDVRTDNRYICGNPEVRSEVVVPLRGREGPLGVLAVESTQVDGFSPRDVMMLSTFAAQLAVAIENARLYQRTLDQLAQLQAAQEQLLQSARMAAAGELASGLAHEINNPLAVILGNAELLQLNRGLDPKAQVMIESICRGADRIANIVRVFLSLAAPTARPPAPIALDPLIRSVADRLGKAMSDQKVELELDLPPDLPKVRANPEQLMQVFLNLMANAIEAMPQGGRLTVAATAEQLAASSQQGAPHLTVGSGVQLLNIGEGQGEGAESGAPLAAPCSLPPANVVVIRFSDTGKGIAPENLGRVFEPGFTTKIQEGRVRGVGLGLYSARQIIKAHGGSITLQSELDVGTTVTVTLQAAERLAGSRGQGAGNR